MKFLLLSALLTAGAIPVAAQPNCAPRDQVTKQLTDKYAQVTQVQALYQSAIMEVWANLETGTWSIVINRPDGISCIPASGTAFQPVAVVKGEAT